MTIWLRELILSPYYDRCDPEDPESLRALSTLVYKRLSKLKDFNGHDTTVIPFLNARRRELILQFKDLSMQSDITKDDFNRTMVWLYNWADTVVPEKTPSLRPQKACWVSTS